MGESIVVSDLLNLDVTSNAEAVEWLKKQKQSLRRERETYSTLDAPELSLMILRAIGLISEREIMLTRIINYLEDLP